MGRLVLGQRLDVLAKALAEEVAREAVSPLQRQIIFVPTGRMRSWLLLELAKHGVVAGTKVLPIGEWVSKDLPSFWEIASAVYLKLLENGEEELAPYLQKNGCMDLAEHLTSLFQQYGEYAPQFFGTAGDWQRKLLHKIFVEGNLRAPVQLSPQKVAAYCFGIDFLPPCYWNFFSPVSVYLFSPCVHFWEDVCSSWEKRKLSRYWRKKGVSSSGLSELEGYLGEAPLPLANWGKLGRETLKAFEELLVEEAYGEIESRGLLGKVQSFLLYFEKPAEKLEWGEDSSLRLFRTGSSRYREVEVLCEEILCLAREEKLLFSEMAVLVPDVNEYAPLIELLFSQYQIPYQITGVEIGSKSPFLQGLYRLLDVLSGEWNREALCALFETPSFYRRLEWDEEMLEKMREWVSVAVHSGLGELIKGLTVLLPEQLLRIEMGEAEVLERFIGVFQALSEQRIEGEKTLVEWAAFLEALSQQFLVCDGDDEAWLSFQKILAEMRRVEGTFPFEWVRRWIKRPIYGQIHSTYLHAVSVASFSEGNLTCQKALFLLGVDEESFPRRNVFSSLNLLKKEKGYFPESMDWDRYLFLRALFSATHFLRISYGHISREEGKPIGPSAVVEELFSFLDSYFTREGKPISPFLIEQRGQQGAKGKKSFAHFPQTPSFDLPEGEWTVSLSDLSLLMRHPWKFYLRKVLGIRLEERKEPSLYLKKEILARASLTESIEQRLVKEFPPGLIGKALSLEVLERASEWKKLLPGPLFSALLLESCREKKSGERSELPCLEMSIGEKTRVRIVGEIQNLSSEALVYPGKDDLKGLLRIWPQWLCSACALGISNLLCLKSGKTRAMEAPQKHLESLLRYFFAAQSAPSPLLPEWADPLLRKGVEELGKKMAGKGVLFEDPVLDWMTSHFEVPSAKEFETQWGAFLRETFSGLK